MASSLIQFSSVQFSSVAQSCPTLWDPMSHSTPGLLSITTPGVHSNSCPSSQWCHPTISSFVVPFSSCPQSLPASESFPMSQLFAWGGQSTGVSASASFPPKKSQGWSPSEWTGWISLQSKGLSESSPTPQFKSINSSALSLLQVCIVKAMLFSVVMYGCESWTVKKAERRRIDAFELWCWRRLWESLGLQWEPTSPF